MGQAGGLSIVEWVIGTWEFMKLFSHLCICFIYVLSMVMGWRVLIHHRYSMGKYRSKSSEREGLCFHLSKGAEGLGKPLTFQARVGGSHTGRYQPRGRRPGDTPWPRAYKGDAGSARVWNFGKRDHN